MVTLIRCFFWFWFPAPRIGETYVHVDYINDPWNERDYRVVEQKGNWYRLRGRGGYLESKHRSALVAFYRKTADPSTTEDGLPF